MSIRRNRRGPHHLSPRGQPNSACPDSDHGQQTRGRFVRKRPVRCHARRHRLDTVGIFNLVIGFLCSRAHQDATPALGNSAIGATPSLAPSEGFCGLGLAKLYLEVPPPHGESASGATLNLAPRRCGALFFSDHHAQIRLSRQANRPTQHVFLWKLRPAA